MNPDENPAAVQHTHKTVRRQFIDLRVPRTPDADEEAFIVSFNGDDDHAFEFSPRDYQQAIACLRQAASDAGMVA